MTRRPDTLEADLRAVLRHRADDVSVVPESVFAFEQQAVPTGRQHVAPRRGPHAVLAVAAAVLVVLVVVGGVVAAVGRGHDHHAPPVQTGTPTTTPRPAPPSHVARSARLSWFGIDAVSGYTLGERDSRPGYQTLGLARTGDTTAIAGSDGGAPWQAYVTVFEAGAFSATTVGRSGGTTRVGNATGFFGSTPLNGQRGSGDAPTLAWRSPQGRWVLVQGRTATTSTHAALLQVARAVRPDATTAAAVPFRLGYAPPGARVSEMYADLGGQRYPFRIELTSSRGDVTLMVSSTLAEVGLDEQVTPTVRSVDGRRTLVQLSTASSATALGPATFVGVLVGPAGGEGGDTAIQRTLFDRLLGGLTFPATPLPAEAAIP